MPRYEHRVTPDEQGLRLDVLLARLPRVSSRAAAVRFIESGAVRLNGTLITAKRRVVMLDDLLDFEIAEKIEPYRLQPGQDNGAGLGADIPLDIRFEDEHLIVLSKQAGLVVHPARGHESDTLVNALIAHCGTESLALIQGEDRPGIVHRLDKDTSGLMLVAKTEEAGVSLSNGIRTRSIDRRYLTLVHGYIAPNTGLVDAPIARGDTERKRMFVSDRQAARGAITTFRVLERFEAAAHDEGYSYLECKLYTGRTHQIRVHMDYIGHSIVGDALYGSHKTRAQLGLNRQFLHSWHLDFVHPITGEPLGFSSTLPEDLSCALSSLGERSLGKVDTS
ncbi:MAG: RluA family pseudouridine synthase [Coriobacteriales bacterium]|jgi:23S rRNA pseudouridine1911/1915/1917 synthase|nr:RluA family pseudouridine synthase [Coriobacteriales bacterium]